MIALSQQEADVLIKVEKHFVPDEGKSYEPIILPELGGAVSVELECIDKKEEFRLDIWRQSLNLSKTKNQTRVRKSIVLVRLDIGGSGHRNPDDQEVPPNHLHIYREGYGDKWAYPVPTELFPNTHDFRQTIKDFLIYCNITKFPEFGAQEPLMGLFL